MQSMIRKAHVSRVDTAPAQALGPASSFKVTCDKVPALTGDKMSSSPVSYGVTSPLAQNSWPT